MNSNNIWDTIKELKNTHKKKSVTEMITNINTQENKNKLSYVKIPSKNDYLPKTSHIKYMRPIKPIPNYLGSSTSNNVEKQKLFLEEIQLKLFLEETEPKLKSINYSNNTILNLSPVMWIDSSDYTSLILDSNNNVSQILDKSGINNHMYQSVIANQPKYHNGGLLFNGNQYMNVHYNNNYLQNINNMSIFIVMKQYNQTNQWGGIISGYSDNSTNDLFDLNAWVFNSSDFTDYQYLFSSNQNVNGDMVNTNNINETMPFGVYEIIINNNTGYIYYNGNLKTTGSFPTLGTFNNIVLGARFDGSNTFNKFYTGEIYETIIFNSVLDPDDRYSIEKLLLDKWNSVQISRTIPLNNIYTWLDASSPNNFILDSSNNVLSWNDKNFNLNFTQSNSSFYPIFDTNKVIFNNSYLAMTDANGLDLNNFSIFYVFEEITHNNNAGLLSCINTINENDSQITTGFALITPSSNTIDLIINEIQLSYIDQTSLSKKLYEFNINNGNGILYINGVQQSTQTFGSLGTGLKFAIGARQINGEIDISNPLNANIYELLILNNSADYQQRNQIYSYLSEKWNIACILSKPSPNPTLWLDSNNAESITVDNGSITGWNDLSSNNYTVTINNTPPLLQEINNINGAYFNESDININFNSSPGGNLTGSYSSFYLVFSGNNYNNNNYNRLISFNNGTSDNSTDSFNFNSSSTDGTLMYNSSTGYYETINYNNNLYIISILKNNTNVNLYINNYFITTLINQSDYNYATLDLGSLIGGSQFWTGYIAEIIFYNSLLDSNSNLGTIKYLANKWGVNIEPSSINQYIPRMLTNQPNYMQLNGIISNTTYLTVSDTTDKSKNINMNAPLPINNSLSNQLTLSSTDSVYLTTIDINTVYNVIQYVNDCTIILPTLTYDSDYFAFVNNGVYTFTITGPNGLNTTCSPSQTLYLTNIDGTYSESSNFQGFTCILDHYTNSPNTFKLFIGGWSKTLSYIKLLYVYDSANEYIATTEPIYFKDTFQADFTLNTTQPGTYNFVITDIKSDIGNIISSSITTPVIISDLSAVLDHYNNGSSTYNVTLYNWESYSSITTLDVWVSNSNDYSNSIYLTTTDVIQNNEGVYTTIFTNTFTNNYYWITLKNTDPVINLQITQPIVITNNPNLSFSLDNILHTGLYNIILDNWEDVYTNNILILYVFAYTQSDFSDIPIHILNINTSLIVNNAGVYSIPLNFEFYIDRNYYLSVSDTIDFSGIFNVELTNNINALTINAAISPSYGFTNNDNVFTITLSNNESYDLTNYLVSWNIFDSINIDGYDATLITSSTLNSNQTLVFTYDPGNLSSVYFCIGNTSIITPTGFIPTYIPGFKLWLDGSDPNGDGSTVLDESILATWVDKSGNMSNATPLYGNTIVKNTIQNNLSVIRMDATQVLSCSLSENLTSYTIFTVQFCAANTGSWQRLLNGTLDGTIDGLLMYGVDADPTYILTSASWSNLGINQPPFDNFDVWVIVSAVATPSSLQAYINGSACDIRNDSSSTISGFTIGGHPDNVQNWDGDIGEILVYNSALSNKHRRSIEEYLATKWNISITQQLQISKNNMKFALNNNIKYVSNNMKFVSKQLVISNKISKILELSVIEPKFKILPKI